MIATRRALIPRQTAFWLIATAVFLLLLWLLRDVLLPFVLAMALAYILDPLADRMEKIGFRRWVATVVLLAAFVGTFVAMMVVALPLIRDQVLQLIEQIPHYADYVRGKVLPAVNHVIAQVSGVPEGNNAQSVATSYSNDIRTWLVGLLGSVWSGGLAVVNILYVMLLTPLVAFYLLRDWDSMLGQIDSWLPRRQADTVRDLAREIDAILAGFVRGQALVCFLLAIYYAVALSLTGLNFAIIIGIAAGILSFIPYLGAIAGLLVSIGVAFSQFNDFSQTLIVAAVYIFGHAVEANLITPNLVGDRVQLHPVWVLFALLAGGALFGFTGVLLAVPVAAVIGVVVRFSLRQYLSSSFFDDRADRPSDQTERVPSVELGQL